MALGGSLHIMPQICSGLIPSSQANIQIMSQRKIISVGVSFPGNDIEYVAIDSDQSLLDADIILFQPGLPYSYRGVSESSFQGKPTLGSTGSYQAVEHAAHWKSELKTAIEEGKTVIAFLAQPVSVFVYTGETQHSGTGRSRQTSNIVRPFTSYEALPVQFANVVPRRGQEVKVASDLGAVAAFWREFAPYCPYEVYIEGPIGKVLLTTKTGNKTVGAIIASGAGHLVLLPPISFDEEAFTHLEPVADGDEGEVEGFWNEEGIAFEARLIEALIRLDSDLRSEKSSTPPPAWSAHEQYRLAKENSLALEISSITTEIDKLVEGRRRLMEELASEGTLRALLFASGAELEHAILEALKTLGYAAENHKAGESEFDAVFLSPEGDRFLGEAEGKDNKPINIDKLSQLERNIHEDFARDEISEYAHGVLFGNAFRLQEPAVRSEFFTAKCLSAAKRSGIALVRTTDLFDVARAARTTNDHEFVYRCRLALREGAGGIVKFPSVGS